MISRFSLIADKKKRFLALLVLAGVSIVLLILYQAGVIGGPERTLPGEKAPTAFSAGTQWQKIEESTLPVYYVAAGTVRSRKEASITSRLPAARITAVNVRNGDMVKQGDVLIELEDSDLRSAADSAEENLKQQESRQTLMQQKYDRTKALRGINAMSQQELDEALSNLNSAKAMTAMLQHDLDNARVNLSYATIRSPFDGIVAERMVDPGNMATQESVLVKIFEPDQLEVRLPVRESLALQLNVGDMLETHIESLDKTVQARIVEITPSVDPGSRTFQINIMLTGDTSGVRPGMFGRTAIKVDEKKAVLIPSSAIRRVGQLEYVTIKNNAGEASEVMISTVPGASEDLREVVSGLQAGDAYFMLK